MPTNFLWSTGFSGLTVSSQVTLMSTELVSLAASTSSTSGIAVSVATGSSGYFTSTWTGQAVWGEIMYSMGAPGSSVNVMGGGANLSGWFLISPDGGVTSESTVSAPPRPPDFIIPFPPTTIAPSASPFKASQIVRLPPVPFRVMVQNVSTNTLGGSSAAPTLKLAPVAMQY
jgi:hypothetical protein